MHWGDDVETFNSEALNRYKKRSNLFSILTNRILSNSNLGLTAQKLYTKVGVLCQKKFV